MSVSVFGRVLLAFVHVDACAMASQSVEGAAVNVIGAIIFRIQNRTTGNRRVCTVWVMTDTWGFLLFYLKKNKTKQKTPTSQGGLFKNICVFNFRTQVIYMIKHLGKFLLTR